MLVRTSLISVTFTALIAATAGCSHQQTASATNTMSLAQGDAVGRALLTPAPAAQTPETATAQVDLSPADE